MRVMSTRFVPSRFASTTLALAIFGAAAGCGGGSSTTPPTFNFAWDWTGIIGTGQSLSVGALGTPVLASQQPYNNMPGP